MRKVLALWLIVAALTLAASPPGLSQQQLVVLHSNDLHGQSLSRLATLLESERQANPFTLWVDAGDLFSGTAISQLFKGEAEIAAVLALGLDAITFGNHDFDFGLEVIERSLAAGVPWVSANVWREDGSRLAQPFFLKELAGTRVLITGVSSPETPRMSFPENVAGLVFADPTTALKELLRDLAGSYDLCLVLSHLGYGEDLLLAQRIPEIHVIIGGHTHTVLDPPLKIKNTLIAQSGANAEYLGRIAISLEEDYQAQGELLRLDSSIKPHPTIAALDQSFEERLAGELDEVIGFSPFGYVKNGLGLLLVQALQEYTGADAALYNGGGVRAGLPAGAVTRRDVFTVEPFGNQVVLVTLTGAQFAELLAAKQLRTADFYRGPRLVDTAKTYTVATSDFLTTPTSSYSILAEGQVQFFGVSVREVLEDFLASKVLEQKKQGAH